MEKIKKKIADHLQLEECWFPPNEIDYITARAGAYILLIRLETEVEINFPSKAHGQLLPGIFVYCGNAGNNGGIRARLRHHFKMQKKHHWHVDRLTTKSFEMSVFAIEQGNECLLLSRLLELTDFRIAIPGFGSSDCKICDGHLLAFNG